MHVLLATAGLCAVSLVTHLVVWRIRLPKNHTRALLLVFGSVLACWLAYAGASGRSLPDLLQVALLYVPVSFCYIITYSAVEGDSPTLSLMRLLAQKRTEGISKDEVADFLSRRPFVEARLAALVRSGLVREENGRYVIAGKPSLPFRIVLGFRKLYGPISDGG